MLKTYRMDSKNGKQATEVVVTRPSLSPCDTEVTTGDVQNVSSNGNVIDDGLQRGLKSRHLQMIAFGGVVG